MADIQPIKTTILPKTDSTVINIKDVQAPWCGHCTPEEIAALKEQSISPDPITTVKKI